MEMNGLDQLPRLGVFLDQMGLEATLPGTNARYGGGGEKKRML